MSKSVIELLNEVRASEELQKEAAEVLQKQNNQAMIDFLRKHDCDATLSEAKEALLEENEKIKDSGELTPEELEAAAGGSVLLYVTVAVGTGIIAGLSYLNCEADKKAAQNNNNSSSNDSGC